jgi:hypothetical protein
MSVISNLERNTARIVGKVKDVDKRAMLESIRYLP